MALEARLQKEVMRIIEQLREATRRMEPPASVTLVKKYGRDPYLVLVACLLSLRTKDTVSLPAADRLFAYARTPQEIVDLPVEIIEQLIYPVGFYRRRARNLQEVSRVLIDRFGGTVPCTQEELKSLPGVGLKTANLVLSVGFDIPALCVDTHVHRISNRFGLVHTNTPEETEAVLQKIIPREHWIEYCNLLVVWGQNVCSARGPKCAHYPQLAAFCGHGAQ